MANYQQFPQPERPRGVDAERWQQMYRYMYEMVEQLNTIIESMSGRISALEKAVQERSEEHVV